MIHFPPGTDKVTRHRVECWARFRKHKGRPAPCWGFYLHAIETLPDRIKANSASMRQALNDHNKKRRLEAMTRKKADPEGLVKNMEETIRRVPVREQRPKLTPKQILDAVGLSAVAVGDQLRRDGWRRCA